MDFEIPQNITFTTDGVSWGLSSSQSEDLDEFLAIFDCACANGEPLDATEFAKAQGLGMMREFHYIDQSSSVNSGAVTEESGGRQTPSRTVVDGPTVIANPDRATGPKVKALSISQVTALGIEPMSPERPELAMTQVTAFEVPPKVPQVPVLAMSQVTTLDLKAKLLETSNVIISPIKTLDLSHTPTLEILQADAHNPNSTSSSTQVNLSSVSRSIMVAKAGKVVCALSTLSSHLFGHTLAIKEFPRLLYHHRCLATFVEMSNAAPSLPSQALMRRDEPTSPADHVQLIDAHLSNITTTAKASRIRIYAVQLYLHALEQQADEALQREKVRTKQLQDLQKRYEKAMSKLRLSRIQTLRLRVELRLARDADLWHPARRRRNRTRRC
ncbi:hypothetical protein E8E12_000528 [Didymella heteroderae]|uniref:Uncharacterized protein n=1 Tax=Didymella heteroderae TaxID=1769908 RepID=A0A9P4WFF3_9PLEO|nr:hypothetical protein E8E12_000528 [Didymella heteroderae]